MFRCNLLEIFNRIELNGDCDGCQFLRETEDMFGTGDSPSDHHCVGTCYNCPRVQERVDELNEWMSEYPAEFEVIEEVR